MLLTISSTAINAQTQHLENVPAGYFISDSLADKLTEIDPAIQKILDNAMRVEGGYFMDDQSTKELANKIEELKADNKVKDAKIAEIEKALKEEREFFEVRLENKNEIIDIQADQIDLLKAENETLKDNQGASLQEKISYGSGGVALGVLSALVIISLLQ